MNLALLSALIGNEQALFLNNLYVAIAHALPKEQQLFVSGNIRGLHTFLQSDAGRLAVQNLVDDWQHVVKKEEKRAQQLATGAGTATQPAPNKEGAVE